MAINKFRLGNNKLHIETGRYTTPKTPVNQSICSFCHSNEIEDEKHVLFCSPLYDSFRLELNNKIARKYPCFENFDHNSKVLFLFNNADPSICRLISAFICHK